MESERFLLDAVIRAMLYSFLIWPNLSICHVEALVPLFESSNQFDTSSPEEIADNKQQNVRTRFHEDAINSTSARAGGQTGGRVGGWAGGWVRERTGRQAVKIKAEEA